MPFEYMKELRLQMCSSASVLDGYDLFAVRRTTLKQKSIKMSFILQEIPVLVVVPC